MERLEVANYEEIRSGSGKWLEDCTLAVFEGDRAFRDQLQDGTDHWTNRLPTALGIAPWGDHGVAVGDVDGDRLDDVYFCQPGGLPNQLYRHRADGTLQNISTSSGTDWLDDSRSALLIDIDNDGDQDLVIASREFLLFMQNDGRGHFRLAADHRAARDAFSLSAADYDQDGDLDIFACRYYPDGGADDTDRLRFSAPVPYHDARNGPRNILLRNDGSWAFHDATDEAGIGRDNCRWSYAAAWEDFDRDGDQDLYVANDFGPNYLYRNDRGTFAEIATSVGASDASTGMSVDWADVNHDGWSDLYIANMYSAAGMRVTAQAEFRPSESPGLRERHRKLASGNTLLLNDGKGAFEDRSLAAGVTMGRWAWSSNFVDLNNDSWDDILVANGYYSGSKKDDL